MSQSHFVSSDNPGSQDVPLRYYCPLVQSKSVSKLKPQGHSNAKKARQDRNQLLSARIGSQRCCTEKHGCLQNRRLTFHYIWAKLKRREGVLEDLKA